MNSFSLTNKQAQLFADWKHGRLKRINILEGSVRSGKTYSSLILWGLWLATQPADGRYLMAGRTLTSLKRNCLEPLSKLLGADNMRFSTAAKRAVIFDRTVDLEGAANALSENKIRGLTLNGAYVDEITLLPRDFFVMLLSRLSAPGAQLFGTTNPDSPGHWLKTEFLDRPDLDLYRLQFLLEDNTALPAAYIENLRREYTGVYFDRFIRGQWVAAEGAVYPMFSPERHVCRRDPQFISEWIGVDYGHSNPTCFLRLGMEKDSTIWVIDEYYHSADRSGAKSPREYARDLAAFAAAGAPPELLAIDPSAEGFILQLREDSPQLRVRRADNRVCEGIQLVASALSADLLRIHPRCRHLIRELAGYRWDPKAGQIGQDKPIKTDDHACDALRYALMARRREINRSVMHHEKQAVLSPDPLALARL